MWLIDPIQWLAAAVPPEAVGLATLLVAGLSGLAIGCLKRRREMLPHVPTLLFFAFGALTLWPKALVSRPSWLGALFTLATAVSLIAHIVGARRQPVDPRDDGAPTRAHRVYLALTLMVAALILFHDLGGYAGSLIVWEAPVTAGFGEAMVSGHSIWSFAWNRLLWEEGLLSRGDTSLFYGLPTFAIFRLAGASAWTLRCASVLAALGSIVVAHRVARRAFGPTVGVAAAVLFGLNGCVLFYGRYGSSGAGTLLAVLLALWATWALLEAERPAWRLGPLCALALYAATLQYAPARLVVLVLLATIAVTLMVQWRRLSWRRLAAALTIAGVAAIVWQFQRWHETEWRFASARGEQFLACVQHADCLKEYLRRPARVENPTPYDKLELLYRTLEVTVPQYVGLLSPVMNPVQPGGYMAFDPPTVPLYYAPLALFILLGIGHSLVRVRSVPHASLFAWVICTTPPLLLTNRVDTHRAMLLIVPLTLWGALGVWEGRRALRAACGPIRALHGVAAVLALSWVVSDVSVLYYSPVARHPRIPYAFSPPQFVFKPPAPSVAPVLAEEMASIRGRIALGAAFDFIEVAWLQLTMIDRSRRDPQLTAELLEEGIVAPIRDDGPYWSEDSLRAVQERCTTSTVLLAPALHFNRAVAELRRRGVRVTERTSPRLRFWRLDGGAGTTGLSDAAVSALPTPGARATPTLRPGQRGRRISLTELAPVEVTFGFAPPTMDRTYEDQPIVMGGRPYEHGIGTHAWTRMRYAVPAGAELLEAVVGLSDSVKDCGKPAVTFEIRDDRDHLRFDSGVMDASAEPRAIRVDVSGTKMVTLVVTEGGNGRDCDHANWADPVFIVPR